MAFRFREGFTEFPGLFLSRFFDRFRLLPADGFLAPSLFQPCGHLIRRHPVSLLLFVRQLLVGDFRHAIRILDADEVIPGRYHAGIFQNPAGPQGHIICQGGGQQDTQN